MGALLKHVNGAFRKLWFSGTHWTLSEAALSHPSHPHIRTHNLNVVRDGNSGGFASNVTPQNEQLEEDDCATVGGGWTMGAAWQASFAEGQEGWRQRILIYISIEVTPSEYCVHVNMGRVCFCHHSMALIYKKTASVYRGSNYQQLIRGLCRVCVNSVGSEGCPAVSVTSPVVLFTQTQSSDTVDRGAL